MTNEARQTAHEPAPVTVSLTHGRSGHGLQWSIKPLLLHCAAANPGEPKPVLDVLRQAPEAPPTPGHGETVALWELLASVAALDLSAARVLEPHLDAASILDQAGLDWEPGTAWGVYAAEGRGVGLHAKKAKEGNHSILDGEKPWCSLAFLLDRAVVTATVPDGRAAFMTDLHQRGVKQVDGRWKSLGLSNVVSGPVGFTAVRAQPVGGTNWYLNRPGFAWGGIGVAACWFGGAVGLFRTLYAASLQREPDQLALAWLGEADRLLSAGAAILHQAAASIDSGVEVGWQTAHRVRGQIAALSTRMLSIVGEALGPGPLAFDADHARRVADLGLYIRQHHAARDDAALGRQLLNSPGTEQRPSKDRDGPPGIDSELNTQEAPW